MTIPLGFGVVVEHLRRSTVAVQSGRAAIGSGFIIDAAGSVVTNAHVVRSDYVEVQLWDGRYMHAEVKARDPAADLALLSLNGSNLPVAPLGDSHSVRVGELVIAVGNPFGFLGAVTVGVVHAFGRIRALGTTEWVQSDIQLAPGNSGGPLADSMGTVVGVNTMLVGKLGLALPVDSVRAFLARGEERRPMGVVLRSVALAMNRSTRKGFLILEVTPGSPAETAALLPGDVIIGLDGLPLESIGNLHVALHKRADQVVRVQFLRGGRSNVRTASLVLAGDRSKAA